jgi:hypothetical protein
LIFSLPAEFLNTATDPRRWGLSAGSITLRWAGRSPDFPLSEFVHLTSTLPLVFSLYPVRDEQGSIYIHHNFFCSNSGFVPKSAYCLEKADSVTPTGVPSSNCQEIYSRIDKPRFMLCLKREFISEPNKYDEFEDILSSFISLQLKDCKFITGGIIDAAIYI